MTDESTSAVSPWSRAACFLAVVAIGIAASIVAAQYGDPTLKKLIKSGMLLTLVGAIVVTRHPKRVLLFTWVVALSYNRQYYSFDTILGNNGSQGLYWIPADALFAALLAIWVYERVMLNRRQAALSRPVWPWMTPYLAACLASSLASEHMNWGFSEVARLLKFGLILLYFRFNVRKEEWWILVAAFGFTILVQSTLGVFQVLFNLGSTLTSLVSEGEFQHRAVNVLGSQRRRASGTLFTPNFLGPYLLLVVPIFLGLMLTARHIVLRVLCGVVTISGLVGIAFTLSRMPWAVIVFELSMLFICLTWWGVVKVKRSVGLLFVYLFLAVVAMLPYAKPIYDRFVGNFKESLDFRTEYNQIALDMWYEGPLLGIGLNHHTRELASHDKGMADLHSEWEQHRRTTHTRADAPVHNLFLLILSETGLLGFLGFLLVIGGTIWIGVRAAAQTQGVWCAVCLALVVAVIGQMIQQTMDFSLWVDPGYYTFAIMIGMLNLAPALAESPE